MLDLVGAMIRRDIKIVSIEEADDQEINKDKYQLVYMSPESFLADEKWRDM